MNFRPLHSVLETVIIRHVLSVCNVYRTIGNPYLISYFEFVKMWLQITEELIITIESLKMFEVLEKPL